MSATLGFGLFSAVFPHIFSVNMRNPAIPVLTGFNQFGECFGAHVAGAISLNQLSYLDSPSSNRCTEACRFAGPDPVAAVNKLIAVLFASERPGFPCAESVETESPSIFERFHPCLDFKDGIPNGGQAVAFVGLRE
jgi:hypothetical protein